MKSEEWDKGHEQDPDFGEVTCLAEKDSSMPATNPKNAATVKVCFEPFFGISLQVVDVNLQPRFIPDFNLSCLQVPW